MGKSKELATLTDDGGTFSGDLDVSGVARNSNAIRVGAATAGTGYGLRIGSDGATDPLEIWRDHTNGNQKQFSIDYFGRVTMPYQPAFEAYSPSGGSIAYQTETKVDLSVEFDIGGNFNAANDRFTAPVSGRYYFYGTMQIASAGTPHINFKVNGTNIRDGWIDAGDGTGITLSRVYSLTAGDYVELWTWNVSAGSYNANRTKFGGYLVG